MNPELATQAVIASKKLWTRLKNKGPQAVVPPKEAAAEAKEQKALELATQEWLRQRRL